MCAWVSCYVFVMFIQGFSPARPQPLGKKGERLKKKLKKKKEGKNSLVLSESLLGVGLVHTHLFFLLSIIISFKTEVFS